VTTKGIRSRVLNVAQAITEQRKMTEFDVSCVQGGLHEHCPLYANAETAESNVEDTKTKKKLKKKSRYGVSGKQCFCQLC